MPRLLPTLLSLSLALVASPTLAQAKPVTPADRAGEAREHLKAIARLDDAPGGPQINAVIVFNPAAAKEAEGLAGTGPLDGRTVLVKDNVETREWPTTAGSLALKDNRTGRDAPLIARMRAAGGVVLGKTNLSEWANIRHSDSTSGWSAIGGLTRNPHALDRNACGSSSGSGAAIAAGMAWAAIGTETDGSITCPAAVNGIVGFKPTVGLVSRTHVVPISASQDTAGPMTRTVADAALLLGAIAGSDPADAATAEADARKVDYTRSLATASLKGVRIGVLRNAVGNHDGVKRVFEAALTDLKAAGAELVEIEFQPDGAMYRDEGYVLRYELRRDLNAYLATLPGQGLPKSLGEVIAFNQANADKELRWFGQDIFIAANQLTDQSAHAKARANSLRLAGKEGIDKLLADHRVSLLVAPTAGPAWTTDLVSGDRFLNIGMGSLAAIAGYPHLTVPMGAVEGLPVGLSLMGAKWQDEAVLQAGAAYERARTAPLPQPRFRRWGE
ncbi:amidase [Novosphingobium sp.]|uniref:amidase n=1 Tax=Novosphingobium sp. TaxID=1874826 RepID=UPI0022BE56C8|nr:amidase [Novosphingobium sp.]MCZ8017991.1 amidase [Novosphingobium sp.]MCZ8034310.1 amidase [Novosphingobium sp.]MCZ8052278.1 amidase [Novosphingobium sp.]MCZ8061294.1 amidase [Novosphingobium sp.]MCZ8232774.1 amidase [Novosphingobium sp.]